jgi:hypothetical protein
MVVHLGTKHGLTDNADNDLLPVAGHLGMPAPLTQCTDHARRERMGEVPRLAIGAGAVSTMPLGLLRVARSRLVSATGE